MIEHILGLLAQTGWQTDFRSPEVGTALDQGAHRGLLFTYLTQLNSSAPTEQTDRIKWDVIIICPEGLDSSQLQNPGARRTQYWYWDLKTGYVFPYPASKDNKVMPMLAALAQGKPVPLFSDKARLDKYIPFVSYSLIGIIAFVFVLMTISGGSTNQEVLIRFGAKVNALIEDGEIWRFLTSSFLHIGILHLGFNLYALWALGPFTEKLYGHGKFLAIYLASGIGGSVASYFFSPAISAGASGSIFGLLGALLVYSRYRPEVWKSGLGTNLIVIIVINLAFGFSQPGIDNYAHLGGLLTGMIIGLLFHQLKGELSKT